MQDGAGMTEYELEKFVIKIHVTPIFSHMDTKSNSNNLTSNYRYNCFIKGDTFCATLLE